MRLLQLLCALCCFTACASAKPYERDLLSKASIDLSAEGESLRFRNHLHTSREAASGGDGTPGGGCGCN